MTDEQIIAMCDAITNANHHNTDTLERSFERETPVNTSKQAIDYDALLAKEVPAEATETTTEAVEGPAAVETPPEEPEATEVPVQAPEALPQSSAVINGPVNIRKRHHHWLKLEGVMSHCAHCGMALTDAQSISRGLGPVCFKRSGVKDFTPDSPDFIQAMIDLADYPELVEFLTEHYKPQGARGLMNGLVKICSLNRKTEIHPVCCNAIQSLGYDKLASLLRESLAVVTLREPKDHPGFYNVWVKKSDYTPSWGRALRQIPGYSWNRNERGVLIPKNQKKALWKAMLSHYAGLVVKTPKGAFKIERKKKTN